jgi:hypothetical protein
MRWIFIGCCLCWVFVVFVLFLVFVEIVKSSEQAVSREQDGNHEEWDLGDGRLGGWAGALTHGYTNEVRASRLVLEKKKRFLSISSATVQRKSPPPPPQLIHPNVPKEAQLG